MSAPDGLPLREEIARLLAEIERLNAEMGQLATERDALLTRLRMERTFPIMRGYEKPEQTCSACGATRRRDQHRTTIPWNVADKAYSVYRERYGDSQSLEELAKRGGFSAGEMDMLYPAWRRECDERDALRTEVENARKALGEHSKHDIGETLAGAINNVLQIALTSKENAESHRADLRAVAEALESLTKWADTVSFTSDQGIAAIGTAKAALVRPGVRAVREEPE